MILADRPHAADTGRTARSPVARLSNPCPPAESRTRVDVARLLRSTPQLDRGLL